MSTIGESMYKWRDWLDLSKTIIIMEKQFISPSYYLPRPRLCRSGRHSLSAAIALCSWHGNHAHILVSRNFPYLCTLPVNSKCRTIKTTPSYIIIICRQIQLFKQASWTKISLTSFKEHYQANCTLQFFLIIMILFGRTVYRLHQASWDGFFGQACADISNSFSQCKQLLYQPPNNIVRRSDTKENINVIFSTQKKRI